MIQRSCPPEREDCITVGNRASVMEARIPPDHWLTAPPNPFMEKVEFTKRRSDTSAFLDLSCVAVKLC
jgi:hypothetical protein